jgi:hypothetical protein
MIGGKKDGSLIVKHGMQESQRRSARKKRTLQVGGAGRAADVPLSITATAGSE